MKIAYNKWKSTTDKFIKGILGCDLSNDRNYYSWTFEWYSWLLKMCSTPLHDLGRGDSYDHNEKSKFLVSEWKAEKYTDLENLSSKEEILWSKAK